MVIDVLAVIALIYDAGTALIKQCREVKKYPIESARIAMRCQNVLGVLKTSAHDFTGDVILATSLLELRELLERARVMMQRCKRPRKLSARVSRIFKAYSMRESLCEIESSLQRITADLRLPMLADIRKELKDIKVIVARGGHDEDSLLGIGRNAVDKGMAARSLNGSIVGDVIEQQRREGSSQLAGEDDLKGSPSSGTDGAIERAGR